MEWGSNDSALLLIAYDSDGRIRVRPKRLLHRGGRVERERRERGGGGEGGERERE